MSVGKEHLHAVCGMPRSQSLRYDAYYCSNCNVWLDPKCGDPNCVFCKDRYETPVRLAFPLPDLIKGR